MNKGKILKRFLLALYSLAIPFYSYSQLYSTKSASITFFSEAPLENIDATNQNVQSILNASAKTVAFIVPIRGFNFKKDLMEEHFNEKYMESDKYPNATYTGKINE